MLNVLFQMQLTITVPQGVVKLGFQMYQAFDLGAHVRQFGLQHGLHLRTSVVLLPQSQQFLDLVQGEAQLLRVPDKLEFTNLRGVKESIPTGASRRVSGEAKLLIETDRIHAGSRQLRRLPDVD